MKVQNNLETSYTLNILLSVNFVHHPQIETKSTYISGLSAWTLKETHEKNLPPKIWNQRAMWDWEGNWK